MGKVKKAPTKDRRMLQDLHYRNRLWKRVYLSQESLPQARGLCVRWLNARRLERVTEVCEEAAFVFSESKIDSDFADVVRWKTDTQT